MSDVQKSFERLIALAIEREEEAFEFYIEASKRSELSSSARLLKELADQELKHKEKLLNALKQNVCNTFNCTAREIEDRGLSKYLLEIPLTPSSTPQEVLLVAIKREEASFHFYESLSEMTGSGSHRKVFETLAREELKHKERLQQIYDEHIQQWM